MEYSKALKGIYINSSGAFTLSYDDTLKELQTLVGGHIEYLPLTKGLYMIVDEEGKIKRKYVNGYATRIVQSYGINDVIVGNAIIVASKYHKNVSISEEQKIDIKRRAGA